jgi:hypothetical protein
MCHTCSVVLYNQLNKSQVLSSIANVMLYRVCCCCRDPCRSQSASSGGTLHHIALINRNGSAYRSWKHTFLCPDRSWDPMMFTSCTEHPIFVREINFQQYAVIRYKGSLEEVNDWEGAPALRFGQPLKGRCNWFATRGLGLYFHGTSTIVSLIWLPSYRWLGR